MEGLFVLGISAGPLLGAFLFDVSQVQIYF